MNYGFNVRLLYFQGKIINKTSHVSCLNNEFAKKLKNFLSYYVDFFLLAVDVNKILQLQHVI